MTEDGLSQDCKCWDCNPAQRQSQMTGNPIMHFWSGMGPNQYFMISCTCHPTPVPPIRTLCIAYGYSLPIPCQCGILSTQQYSCTNTSSIICNSGPTLKRMGSLQLACFQCLSQYQYVLRAGKGYLRSSRFKGNISYGTVICWC